jgi:hypothetical protein
MKVYELLKYSRETLKTMSRNGILLGDYEYLEAYEHFRHMRAMGVKYDCAVDAAAEESGVARRTLQRAFRRLASEC